MGTWFGTSPRGCFIPAIYEVPGTVTSGAWKNQKDGLENIYNKTWLYNVVNAVSDYTADNTGSSDASTAVSNAITAANGAVFLPAGTYKLSNIALKPGLTIFGEGRATKLIPNNGTTDNIFVFGNDDSNVLIHSLYFYGDGTDVLGSYGFGIYISATAGHECENIRVMGCEFENFSDSGVRCAGGIKKSWFVDNYLHDNTDGGTGSADLNFLGTVEDVTIQGNRCLSVNDTGIRCIPTGSIRKIRIIGNTSIGHDEKGIAISTA